MDNLIVAYRGKWSIISKLVDFEKAKLVLECCCHKSYGLHDKDFARFYLVKATMKPN